MTSYPHEGSTAANTDNDARVTERKAERIRFKLSKKEIYIAEMGVDVAAEGGQKKLTEGKYVSGEMGREEPESQFKIDRGRRRLSSADNRGGGDYQVAPRFERDVTQTRRGVS